MSGRVGVVWIVSGTRSPAGDEARRRALQLARLLCPTMDGASLEATEWPVAISWRSTEEDSGKAYLPARLWEQLSKKHRLRPSSLLEILTAGLVPERFWAGLLY